MHELPALPYADDALEPVISKETISFHYGKHHQTYVNNLNKLSEGTEYADMALEDIIRKAEGGLFNNAAQVWNHSFYWNCMRSPSDDNAPTGAVADALASTFGSVEAFMEKFATSAATNFGSGWTWLVKNADGGLEIVNTSNAGCPLTAGQTPVLTVDVWEHAYYIDYRNARPGYLAAFWKVVNWDAVAANLG